VPSMKNDSATPFKPVRAISYNARPLKVQSANIPSMDMVQIGYEGLWGPKGRDDLGTIRRLGANTVLVKHGIGLEYKTDHSKFLDRANETGLHVILVFHDLFMCPEFDCFEFAKTTTLTSIDGTGFVKNGRWHPAIAMIILIEQPDIIEQFVVDRTGIKHADCNSGALGGDKAKCRTKAAISALDGFLAAENKAGVNGTDVYLSVSWTFAPQDSVDGVLPNSGLYGFQDMLAALADSETWADYNVSKHVGNLGMNKTKEAFYTRWVNTVFAGGNVWDVIKSEYAKFGARFGATPWFVTQFNGMNLQGVSDERFITQSLQDMNRRAASPSDPFLGVCFVEFQHDYFAEKNAWGLFALGDPIPGLDKVEPCDEIGKNLEKVCKQFDVFCLDVAKGDGDGVRSTAIVQAWDGTTLDHGLCLTYEVYV